MALQEKPKNRHTFQAVWLIIGLRMIRYTPVQTRPVKRPKTHLQGKGKYKKLQIKKIFGSLPDTLTFQQQIPAKQFSFMQDHINPFLGHFHNHLIFERNTDIEKIETFFHTTAHQEKLPLQQERKLF